MKNYQLIYTLFLSLIFCASCERENKAGLQNDNTQAESKSEVISYGPSAIVRAIKQDRNGNIWIASWEGVFKYDGKSFTNLTREVSSATFFSVLEDRNGNMWFGSIGSGVYFYNGNSFKNFTINEGLLNNDVVSIYEDKAGNIWFGVFGGASRYDGRSFRNYIISENVMNEDHTGKTFSDRPPYEVNSIIEDKTGKFWFGTRGNTFVYDGESFTVVTNNGKPFTNVRTVAEDRMGNIWLGGNDGLWRYDGNEFMNFQPSFGGFAYEDRNGNMWTSSETPEGRVVFYYDQKSLSTKKPAVTEVTLLDEIIFDMLEAYDGRIWLGTAHGVYRYDGKTMQDFKSKDGDKDALTRK